MPRYFFDLDGQGRETDDEGVIFDGPTAARTEAVIFAGAYLCDNPGLLDGGARFAVNVRDEQGATIVRIVVLTEENDGGPDPAG